MPQTNIQTRGPPLFITLINSTPRAKINAQSSDPDILYTLIVSLSFSFQRTLASVRCRHGRKIIFGEYWSPNKVPVSHAPTFVFPPKWTRILRFTFICLPPNDTHISCILSRSQCHPLNFHSHIDFFFNPRWRDCLTLHQNVAYPRALAVSLWLLLSEWRRSSPPQEAIPTRESRFSRCDKVSVLYLNILRLHPLQTCTCAQTDQQKTHPRV